MLTATNLKNVYPEQRLIELEFPAMSPVAEASLEALDGTIALFWFADTNQFIVTDESLDIARPRWTGETLEDMQDWLETCAIDLV